MPRFLFSALLVLVAAASADAQVFVGGARAGGVRVGPFGGIAAGQSRATVQTTPFGTARTQSSRFTQVTPNGTTIQAGRVAGTRVGPFGASGGSASGVRVTAPNGATQTTTYRRGGFVLR